MRSSAVERYSYKVDVHGPNPCAPTKKLLFLEGLG